MCLTLGVMACDRTIAITRIPLPLSTHKTVYSSFNGIESYENCSNTGLILVDYDLMIG